ncbi:MAG: 23S rRNA (guanosine(2251)-2'-O)-methyltransferase RlmB [Acidobacteria bacterium]|nr:23S rRNA (guanosine(2251)-2'-O)-methyltransferase RlmB [Acidobacteriota bacterium]
MKPKSKRGKPFQQSAAGSRRSNRPETAEKETSSATYGVLPVLELLRSGNRRIDRLLIAEGRRVNHFEEMTELARRQNVRIDLCPIKTFTKYFEDGVNHQGVAAFSAAAGYYDTNKLIDEIVGKENSLCLILDGVEDPGNLGAILRTAEGAGIDGVFIPERRAVGLTETVAKTSAGATEYVKVAKVKNVNHLIDDLKSSNIWVVGASGDSDSTHSGWDWQRSCALVLGSEGKGLHRLTAEKCDVLVKIPMYGRIESLNVSVAAGVILFEALRQREREK